MAHVKRSPPSKEVVEVIDSGKSNQNNDTSGILPTEDRGKNKMKEEDDNPFDNSTSNSNNTTDINNIDNDIDIEPCKNTRVLIIKGVGKINNNKNIVLPSHCFITLTHNEFAALNDNDNNNDNNLYAPVSTLKQKEDDNFFDNYIVSKVVVGNNDALVKINKVNTVDISASTIAHPKEGMETIDFDDTPGTGNNNSNNIIEPSIEPSKVGGGKKKSSHNNTVIVDSVCSVLDHV